MRLLSWGVDLRSRWWQWWRDGLPTCGTARGKRHVSRGLAIIWCDRCKDVDQTAELLSVADGPTTDRETGDPISQVTVSNVWMMNEALRRQLTAWPHFRLTSGAGPGAELYNNHCPHCGAVQQDYMLHSEPGDVFFGFSLSAPGSVEFTPLLGRIQLSGDFGFEV